VSENLYKELLALAYADYVHNFDRSNEAILADLMVSYKKLREDGEK